MISISPTRSRRQQLAGASVTSQRSALGRQSWRVSSTAGDAAAGGASALVGSAGPVVAAAPAAVELLVEVVPASRVSARWWSSTARVCLQSSARRVASAQGQSGVRR
jgi:hypothetical protein